MRVAVVGSGIVGAACAYEASCLGAEVTLVDAGIPGRATAAGAGIICPWNDDSSDPAWYAMACAAAREYPELIARLAGLGETDMSYRQVGALITTESDEQTEQVMRRFVALRPAAPEIGEVRAVSGDEARGMFPPLRVRSAVFIGGAARVDGSRMAGALLRLAERQGVTCLSGHAALAVRSGRVAGVRVDGELIEADAVVAAAGAWTTAFLAPAGVRANVSPLRGQIVHISVGSADTSRWPVVLPSDSSHYMLAFDDSRVVAGATLESAGFDYRVTPAGLAEVLAHALAVAPDLGGGTYLETRVGFRPMGPDIRPLLGPVRDIEGLIVATGLGTTGLTMGPYAGAIAARAALGVPTGIDLSPFDPLR